MELAVNMFTGGMVLDSHPLVQSSDTLSDALNATYITMNGNEVVLLNDMGNRRVDNAYLPAGYEPVGIKEHGGIIYIAAYNPITHRSQIGSFPSPERNMGVEYKGNGTEFDLSYFIGNENIITKEGIKYLKDDVILLPLTNDTSLHAGDKFTVYSGDVWSWGNNGLLTNFGTENLGVPLKYNKTPFNSYFTLSLGIVNSLNEFSDITNSLERFNSSGNIIKGLDIDEDKFNTGYFIAPGSWDAINGLTSNDSTLINEREKIGANTYAYKLTGPLYLKAELNHIQTFSYSMNMSKTILETLPNENPEFKIDLYITGTAVYNCPDSNDDSPYFDSFKLFYKDLESSNTKYKNAGETILSKEDRIFDSTTGLYTSTITKHYIFTLDISHSSDTLNYLITVPLLHLNLNKVTPVIGLGEDDIYISHLSESGSLDISKIGTNECELGMWRYKNTIEDSKVTSTVLDFRFDCYKDLATTFKDLLIQLINQTNTSQDPITLNDIIPIQSEISTGRQLFLIDWTVVEEKERINFLELYLAKITYNQYTEAQVQPSPKTVYRFILGTKLFNPCYDESNEENYTSDFGIFMGTYDDDNGYYSYLYSADNVTQNIPASGRGNTLRNEYLNLWDKITLAEDPRLYSDLTLSEIEGKPVSTTASSRTYLQKNNTYKVQIKYNTLWKIENKELFIKRILITNSSTVVAIPSLGTSVNVEETNIIKNLDDLETENTFLKNIASPPVSIKNETNLIWFLFLTHDRIYIGYNQETRIIGKAYVDIPSFDNRKDLIKLMSTDQRYFCVSSQVNRDSGVGGYAGYVDSDSITGNSSFHELGDHDMWGTQGYTATIVVPLFEGINYLDDLNYNPSEAYEDLIKPFFKKMKCPFTFGLCSNGDTDAYNLYNNYYADASNFLDYTIDGRYFAYTKDYPNGFKSGLNYTRVWWVDEDGNPCLLNNWDNASAGLFASGNGEDLEKRNTIYGFILLFIGYVKIGGSYYPLVAPLENYPYKAYYVDPSSYLYSENTKVNLNVKLNYTLSKDTSESVDSGVTYSNLEDSCLKFFISKGSKTIEKEVNKIYHLGEYSLSIFNFAQTYDLSSYDIDLETGNILSSNSITKKLYVRNTSNNSLLKEVPENYPIQINEGTKNNFPIVCKKRFSSFQGDISNKYLVNCKTDWGYTPAGVDSSNHYHANKARSMVVLKPESKNIPVLFEEDLVINDEHFFDT